MEGMQGHQSLVSDSGLGLAVIYYAFSSAWNFDVYLDYKMCDLKVV